VTEDIARELLDDPAKGEPLTRSAQDFIERNLDEDIPPVLLG
jgi:hypothetical protein